MRAATSGSSKAMVTAVGWAWATSRAKLGPLRAPMGRTKSERERGAGAIPEELTWGAESSKKTSRFVSGFVPGVLSSERAAASADGGADSARQLAMTWVMRRKVWLSTPLVALTTIWPRCRWGRIRASVGRRNSEGTTETTISASATAALSAVRWIDLGMGKPGRKSVFSWAAAIWPDPSAEWDQRVIRCPPRRWRARAMAVPQAPEPRTTMRLMWWSSFARRRLRSGIPCRRAGGGCSGGVWRR